jgi:hypothetical protein
MISGVLGLILGFLVLLNGVAALLRPLDQLVKYDSLGRRILARRGEAFTLRMYRIMGASLALLAIVALYISTKFLMGQ